MSEHNKYETHSHGRVALVSEGWLDQPSGTNAHEGSTCLFAPGDERDHFGELLSNTHRCEEGVTIAFPLVASRTGSTNEMCHASDRAGHSDEPDAEYDSECGMRASSTS